MLGLTSCVAMLDVLVCCDLSTIRVSLGMCRSRSYRMSVDDATLRVGHVTRSTRFIGVVREVLYLSYMPTSNWTVQRHNPERFHLKHPLVHLLKRTDSKARTVAEESQRAFPNRQQTSHQAPNVPDTFPALIPLRSFGAGPKSAPVMTVVSKMQGENRYGGR